MANEDYYHDQNAEALLVSYFVDSYRRDVGHLHQEYMRSILNDMIETQITASELIDKYELTVTDTTERALISASFELFKMWIDGES